MEKVSAWKRCQEPFLVEKVSWKRCQEPFLTALVEHRAKRQQRPASENPGRAIEEPPQHLFARVYLAAAAASGSCLLASVRTYPGWSRERSRRARRETVNVQEKLLERPSRLIHLLRRSTMPPLSAQNAQPLPTATSWALPEVRALPRSIRYDWRFPRKHRRSIETGNSSG